MNNPYHKEITEGKGKKGQNCNVTHCQEPDSAHFFNKVMQAWYCWRCATRIEKAANRDDMSFYDDLPRRNPKFTRVKKDD